MADFQTEIAAVHDRLIYLFQREGRWKAASDTWSQYGGFSCSGESPDTSHEGSAKKYAIRAFLGLKEHEAEEKSNSLSWRCANDVLQMDSTGSPDKACELHGCPHPVQLVVGFAPQVQRPEGWPLRRYFCKGHGKKFLADRGLQ